MRCNQPSKTNDHPGGEALEDDPPGGRDVGCAQYGHRAKISERRKNKKFNLLFYDKYYTHIAKDCNRKRGVF